MHKINPDLVSLAKPIAELHEDPRNARKHQQADLSVIAKSLDEHGQQKPIIATKAGKVIAGNGTLAAARDILKWSAIATVTYESEDQAKQAAFAIIDNRSAELSSWDFDELASLISEMPDNLVGDLGFSDKELQAIGTLVDVDEAVAAVTKEVSFKATVKSDGAEGKMPSKTREVTDLGEARHTCPKCGFEFDDGSKG
jgi:ParB-like chromosome segregation protein Spo0J